MVLFRKAFNQEENIMKRFFTSDSESDMLIAVAANFYDLKTEELINMAIKNEFLPVTEPFRTEAA